MVRRLLILSALLCSPAALASAASSPSASATMQLFVDATEAPRGMLHSRMEIPVKPGPLTLYYPKWIPGEHAPSGPLMDLAGLRLTCDGRAVPWERDLSDMFAIRCTVPAGASLLEVALDALQNTSGNFSAGASTTSQLAVLSWNQLLVYPLPGSAGPPSVTAHLRLPAGWGYGTALETTSASGGEITFATVPLLTLVDSPVNTGAHYRRIDLSPGQSPAHAINIACDSETGLDASPELVAGWRRLVNEGGALFGARHYRHYDFLLTLSDHAAQFGLEHHESSDNRQRERTLVDDQLRLAGSGLLPHEYVHSWIGKYRRPAGLVRSDLQQTMQTDLLWVYEGLTTYLGFVLAARSGLASAESQRERLAYYAAWLDREPGRSWRPLKDTASGAQFLYGSPTAWSSWRRGVDFYREGLLIWLETDVLIRQKSGGKHSLDDFCRLFAGGKSGPPEVIPHTFDDVVKTLNQVVAYDWRGFLTARVDSVNARAPLGGVTGGGWQLAWVDSLSPTMTADEKTDEYVDEVLSIGFSLDKDGMVTDVFPDSPAARAGLAPGMKPIAMDGRRFSVDRLREAIRTRKSGDAPLELLVEQGEFMRTFKVDWSGGPAYPALVRDPSKPDLLSEILKPLTPPVAPEERR